MKNLQKILNVLLILVIGIAIGACIGKIVTMNEINDAIMKYENTNYIRRYDDFGAYLNDMNYEVRDESTDRPGNHLYEIMEYNGLEYQREVMEDENGDWWIRRIY